MANIVEMGILLKTPNNTEPIVNKIKKVKAKKDLNSDTVLLRDKINVGKIEDTTPVLFINEAVPEEIPMITTETSKLSLLTDAVVELLFKRAHNAEYVKKERSPRKKRAYTYVVTHKPYWKLMYMPAHQLAIMVAHAIRRVWRATPHSKSQKFTPEMLLTRPVYVLADKMKGFIFPSDKRYAKEEW